MYKRIVLKLSGEALAGTRGFGLDASWVAFVVLLVALPVVYRLTRELDFRYNEPEIIAAGIPVDLDAVARRQHEAAMGPAAVIRGESHAPCSASQRSASMAAWQPIPAAVIACR